MSPPKVVAICVPIYGYVAASWVQEMIRFLSGTVNKFVLKFVIRTEQPVDWNRNAIVEEALKQGADYLLWIDGDNWVLPDSLEKLVATAELPGVGVVSCLYFNKEKPYYPVLRRLEAGRWFNLDNVPIGQLVSVDGCGLGACLMKRQIFEKVERPWFKFEVRRAGLSEVKLSEDLYFCEKLKAAGFQIICDTSIISAHYGGFVDFSNYAAFVDLRQQCAVEREDAIRDVQDFTSLGREEVLNKVGDGALLLKEEWNLKKPSSDKEKLAFYKETPNYVYDLVSWHFSRRREYDLQLLAFLKQSGTKKVLDFGCGIGANALMLAAEGMQITLADVGSVTLDFATFRFKRKNLPFKVWKVDEDTVPDDTFDVILALDVFEHLSTEQLREAVGKLLKVKGAKTKLIMSNSFCDYDSHPMHEPYDVEKQCLIDSLK